MSESAPVNTIASVRVDDLVSGNAEAPWLKQARIASWEAYWQMAMPTSKDEDWKRTEIDSLNLSNLQAVDLTNDTASKSAQSQWLSAGLKFFKTRAGVVSDTATSLNEPLTSDLQKRGVIFCDLKTALNKHEELIKRYLAPEVTQSPGKPASKFALMNSALFNSGFFLYVPKNIHVNDPFISVTDLGNFGFSDGSKHKAKHDDHAKIAEAHKKGLAVFPRFLVILEANSKINLINILASEHINRSHESTISLCNAFMHADVKDGAELNYLELQRFGLNIFAVTQNNTDVAKDAKLYSLNVGLGGFQLKADICTSLKEPGATCDVQGIVLGDKTEHYSYNTLQNHDAPATESNINFRVALKDKAVSIYQGTITVDKSAQKTNAFQSNKNLLLGSEAGAESIPKLEIFADDVKCSHGATVGPVDSEQIFYLMSRGLSRPQAEEMIVTGFFRQVMETCVIPNGIDWISSLVQDKLL